MFQPELLNFHSIEHHVEPLGCFRTSRSLDGFRISSIAGFATKTPFRGLKRAGPLGALVSGLRYGVPPIDPRLTMLEEAQIKWMIVYRDESSVA